MDIALPNPRKINAANNNVNTGAANKPCVLYFGSPYLRLEMSFCINFTAQNNLQAILYLMGIEFF